MSKLKHTPGRWNIKTEIFNDRNHPVLSIECGDVAIAHVFCNDQSDDGMDEANARLIAAAPEMLEMLNTVAEGMNTVADNAPYWTKEQIVEHAMQIQSLVCELEAKAEGQEEND